MYAWICRYFLAFDAVRTAWRAAWSAPPAGPHGWRVDVQVRPLRVPAVRPALAPAPVAVVAPPAPPVMDTSPRRGESPARSAMDYATQPRMGEREIASGLKRLGFDAETARRAAAVALSSGETDASGLMRRALNAAQGR